MEKAPKNDPFAYHMEEYKSLRDEIMAQQAARAQTERWGVAGILGIYAWLATNPVAGPLSFLYLLGWWVPFAAALYCGFRVNRISAGIKVAGNYLADLQGQLADQEHLKGWEAQIREKRGTGDTARLDLISKLMRTLWFAIILATLAVGIASTTIILNTQS